MKTLSIAAALLALLPLQAGAQQLRPQARVSYTDIDLSKAAGVRVLDRRIKVAAKAVCPDLHGVDPFRQLAAHRCIVSAISSAEAQRNRVVESAANSWQLADRAR